MWESFVSLWQLSVWYGLVFVLILTNVFSGLNKMYLWQICVWVIGTTLELCPAILVLLFRTKYSVTHAHREREIDINFHCWITEYPHTHTCARTQVVDCIWYVLDAIASRQLSCYADQWMIVIFGMRIAFRCEQRKAAKKKNKYCIGA